MTNHEPDPDDSKIIIPQTEKFGDITFAMFIDMFPKHLERILNDVTYIPNKRTNPNIMPMFREYVKRRKLESYTCKTIFVSPYKKGISVGTLVQHFKALESFTQFIYMHDIAKAKQYNANNVSSSLLSLLLANSNNNLKQMGNKAELLVCTQIINVDERLLEKRRREIIKKLFNHTNIVTLKQAIDIMCPIQETSPALSINFDFVNRWLYRLLRYIRTVKGLSLEGWNELKDTKQLTSMNSDFANFVTVTEEEDKAEEEDHISPETVEMISIPPTDDMKLSKYIQLFKQIKFEPSPGAVIKGAPDMVVNLPDEKGIIISFKCRRHQQTDEIHHDNLYQLLMYSAMLYGLTHLHYQDLRIFNVATGIEHKFTVSRELIHNVHRLLCKVVKKMKNRIIPTVTAWTQFHRSPFMSIHVK